MKALSVPLLAVLLLAGCAGSTPPGGAPGGAVPASNAVVLQVEQQGGFVPVEQVFTQTPSLTVYADGRGIVHGPQIAIYPAPALPNLLVHELSDQQVAALIELAGDAGLLAESPDYGQPPIADAMTTVVTLRVNDFSYVHQAYALGLDLTMPGSGQEPPHGISDEEKRARAALSQFIGAVTGLVQTAGEARSYEPDAFAIVASAIGDGITDDGELGVEPIVLPWPIDMRLDTVGNCRVVDGAAAETLHTVLLGANMLTRFEQDGTVYEVASRPLLPGEDGCAGQG